MLMFRCFSGKSKYIKFIDILLLYNFYYDFIIIYNVHICLSNNFVHTLKIILMFQKDWTIDIIST